MSEILKTLILKEPIKHGVEEIKELKFKKPRAGDFRNMPVRPTTGDILDVAGKLCGMLSGQMDQLSYVDMNEVLTIVGELLNSGPKTGES